MRDHHLVDLIDGAVDGWPVGAMRWRPPEILDAELEELADRIHQQGTIRRRITAGITTRTLEATNHIILWPRIRRPTYTWGGEPREVTTEHVASTGVPTGRGTYLHTDPR